jgi:hypothetical protein
MNYEQKLELRQKNNMIRVVSEFQKHFFARGVKTHGNVKIRSVEELESEEGTQQER